MGRHPAVDFRKGILRELDHELRQHCIVWEKTSDRDDAPLTNSPPVNIRVTDRAESLLKCYALALEIENRERDHD